MSGQELLSRASRRERIPANLKDYAGDVVGGNWRPVIQSLYDSGRSMYAPEGTYDLDGDITLNDWAPSFIGAGRGRTVLRQQGSEALFSQYKTGAGVALPKRLSLTTAITADVTAGATTISFDTTGYAAGDYVRIQSETLWPVLDEGAVYGEYARILTIDSASQATLAGGVVEEYLLTDSPTVAKADLLAGLYFADFTFENPDPGTKTGFAYGIYANFCLAPRVERVNFIGLDAAACSVKNSVAWRAIDVGSYDLTAGGYGIYFGDGSRDGLALACHMDGGRHSVTLGSTLNEIPAYYNTVALCTAANTSSHAFDTHGQGRYTKFIGCQAHQSPASGFNNRSLDTTYMDCEATRVAGDGFTVREGALRTRIQGGAARGCGGNGADISGAGTEVEGLRVEDTMSHGVVVNANVSGVKLARVECFRTGLDGSGQAFSIASPDCELIDVYGEDVTTVIAYLSTATGIRESGTRGKNITNLRTVPAAATFAQFQEGERIGGAVMVRTTQNSFSVYPGIDAEVQILTASISADRNVAVRRDNAVAGMRFRIVRTASATGAFNHNINDSGGGTLKTLAVSQWCEVTFDGTAWVLTGFGSL